MSTGQVQIGTLGTGVVANSSSTVYYLNGNCIWTLTLSLGTIEVVDISEAPELGLPTDNIDVFTFQCEVNGSIELNASATVNGKSCSYIVFTKCIVRPHFVSLLTLWGRS